MDLLNNTLALIVLASAAATAVVTWVKWIRPWVRGLRADWIAGRDTLVGRAPVVDSITGKELAPAVPGIGQRIGSLETAIVTIAQNQHDLAQIREDVNLHDVRLQKLEEAAVERVFTRADSLAAWRAMEAVANDEGDDG